MRFDKAFVRSTAKDFLICASAWPHVSDALREAMVDRCVMNCVRMAAAVDNVTPFSPDELLEFRAAIVKQLLDGISFGSSGKRRLLFDHQWYAMQRAAREKPVEGPTESKEEDE
jgi:hypothetical protein